MQTAARVQTADRPIIWLDPRTKVFMLVSINVVLLTSTFDTFGFVLKTLVAMLVLVSLLNARKRRGAIVFGSLFAVALLFEVTNSDQVLALVSSTSIIGILIRFIAMLLLQFIPGTVFAYSMLVTTRVSEFVAAMERMHLSQKIVIPFAVIFRFFPTFAEEYRSIQDAMRMRGISWKKGPVAMLEYRFVPLIVSAVKIGEDLSAASVTRGLGGSVARTNACRIGFGVWDVFFATIMLLALAALFGEKALSQGGLL